MAYVDCMNKGCLVTSQEIERVAAELGAEKVATGYQVPGHWKAASPLINALKKEIEIQKKAMIAKYSVKNDNNSDIRRARIGGASHPKFDGVDEFDNE